jgi:transglutaminase-like putative cysteine protease
VTGWHLVRARARLADTVVTACAVLLSMMCLLPLFAGMRWVLPAIVVVGVVCALGAASRAIALPLPLVPVVEMLGVLGTLTALFAGDEAWGRILPTSAAWDVLRALTAAGMLDAQTYAAPVATWPGMVLLALGGVGLAALSADSLYVSVRSPMLAGLPLLSLYLAPALMLRGGAPWWSFPLAAAGWLLILAAGQRDRMREWTNLPSTTMVRGLSSDGRRIGAVAILAAMVAAVVLPVRAAGPILATEEGAGVESASGAAVVLDPLVSMRRDLVLPDDVEILRYRTQATSPSYLRVTALEAFDGVTWRQRSGLDTGRDSGISLPGNVLAGISTPSPAYHVRGGSSFTYDIFVTNLQNSFLPLPYPISNLVDIRGLESNWRLDPDTGVAFSQGANATGMTYEVTALDPQVKPGELQAAAVPAGDFWPLLSLPSGLSPDVARLATEATAGAKTAYDKAIALQRWFTRDGGFRYSTSVRSGSDADYIAEFLHDRVGYCEQFAASMAIMARTLGIPSRVIVGFTQGSPMGDGGWQVTARDAHAWPELWFDGVGWMRFEPTPRSDASVVAPAYAPAPASPARSGDDRRSVPDRAGFEAVDSPGSSALGSALLRGGCAAIAIAVLVLVMWPMLRRVVRRRQRLHGGGYAHVVNGAWSEVADSAVDLGQPWASNSTPRQAAERLSRGMTPPAAGALRRLRSQVEQVRYAGRSLGTQESAADVRADVRTVLAELRGRVRWQTRLTGYCWPPSERRRHRSSMRSMNPLDLGGGEAAEAVGVVPSAVRTWKDE